MFEVDQQLYEIIFCACSIREEEQWRAELLETPFMENQGQAKSDPVLTFGPSVLPLDIKALGYVFGQPGTLTRRQSIQRAATVKWRKNGLQVIIKNTNSLKDIGESPVSGLDSLSRSQSLPSTNRVPILAPKRAERQRMEQIMSDVWTRERLPYPGMTGNKGGYLIRTSATSVMRKLSRASMTTTSTKRTVSFTSNAEIDLVSCLEESVDEHLDNEDAKIQRKVSYVSMSDAGLGPGRVRIQRVTQTDGASSPPPEFGYGRVGSRLEDQDMADLQLDGPPPKDRVVGRHRERCEASKEATTDRSAEPEHVEGKVRKPRTLLKAFSAEGIRALFR